MKIFYSINEITCKINFFAHGKFLFSKSIRYWWNEDGEHCNNIDNIIRKVAREFNADLIFSAINKRRKIKILLNCKPAPPHLSKISELGEVFKKIKAIANTEFKSKSKQTQFINYMKNWILNYKEWHGYHGGWNAFEEVSNSYNIAISNNLKPLFLLPPYIRNLIKKYKIEPIEKHHAKINEKIMLIGFYSPENILNETYSKKIKES